MKKHAPLHSYHRAVGLLAALLLTLALGQNASAQSTELEYPTPIRANEISGTITARDLGDPRLTRYYYSLTGTPGDLVVTAEGRNLEGDVDVFTVGTLRPLAKISFYAGGSASGGTKTIYLKNRESLILRVEARTPNDNEGSFRVRFEGSFEPIIGDVVIPEPVGPPAAETSSRGKKTRRVNAVGARIEEPEPAPTVAETSTEATSPSTEKPAETPAGTETPSATTAEATKPPANRRRTPTNRRPRAPRSTRNARPPAQTARTAPAVEPAPAPAAEPEAAGPRLIIETRDGTRVERYMTTVRRVTVERGQLIVVTREGKIERQPMSNVLRMAIEP